MREQVEPMNPATYCASTLDDVNLRQTETDETLLSLYRDRGDVSAFEEIVHRYERPIYGYLVRYLRDGVLAEEAFQGTFLRLHEKCRLFAEGRLLRPWLYSIATHQAIDLRRREKKHLTVSLDDVCRKDGSDVGVLVELLRSRVVTPLDQLEAKERRQEARRIVDGLPDQLRVVILLIFFQGLKYREAAQVLDLPLGTVKSRVHKALVTLNREWLRAHESEKD